MYVHRASYFSSIENPFAVHLHPWSLRGPPLFTWLVLADAMIQRYQDNLDRNIRENIGSIEDIPDQLQLSKISLTVGEQYCPFVLHMVSSCVTYKHAPLWQLILLCGHLGRIRIPRRTSASHLATWSPAAGSQVLLHCHYAVRPALTCNSLLRQAPGIFHHPQLIEVS